MVVPREDSRQQAGLKVIELRARIPQAGDFHDRIGSKLQSSADGKAKQVDARSGHILAEIAGPDGEARCRELLVQLGMNQVHLTKVGLGRITRDA